MLNTVPSIRGALSQNSLPLSKRVFIEFGLPSAWQRGHTSTCSDVKLHKGGCLGQPVGSDSQLQVWKVKRAL